MTDEEKALVLGKDSAITEQKAGTKAILNRMVADAVSVARSRDKMLGSSRFTIGDYEFKEPDYELHKLSLKDPSLLEEVSVTQAKQLEDEIDELALEAKRLESEIEELTGSVPI